MAHGHDDVTLASFDTIIPDAVFREVTSISLEQFRFLRDGGDYKDKETQEIKHFEVKLFDSVVFDDSVRKFLALKKRLADYFDEQSVEDIFDYIPPQKTNQIFTPKKVVKKMADMLEEENSGCFDNPHKTFIDLYMKSGLYITEIVKRLYNSETMNERFPERKERLQHIFEKQVFGLAPTEIIYKIATNYILGFEEEGLHIHHNFRHFDALPHAKNGTLEEELEKLFTTKQPIFSSAFFALTKEVGDGRVGSMEDYVQSHKITSYECSNDLLMKPECFMHMCQEMAESHAGSLDFGYDWAIRSGIIWVEISGDFELIRRPRWKEVVTLRSNTGKASALQARRFVEMTDAEGNVLAKADLHWVLIDVETRRPVPLKRTNLQLDVPCDAIISSPMPNMPEGGESATASLVSPRRDIDFNGHINNSAYLIWALDTLPAALTPAGAPARIHIAFKRESHANEPIDIEHKVAGNRSTHLLASRGETRAIVDILWS